MIRACGVVTRAERKGRLSVMVIPHDDSSELIVLHVCAMFVFMGPEGFVSVR
jgi:hypothetical protein